MFGLISGFWKDLTQKPEFKILLLGLEGSGKTTILNQIKRGQGLNSQPNEKIRPTMGLNLSRFDYSNYSIRIWDQSGNKNYIKIWKDYYTDCDCVLFVIDGSPDATKFDELEDVLKNFDSDSCLKDKPIHFILNKNDKPDFNALYYIDLIKRYMDMDGNEYKSINELSAMSAIQQEEIIDFDILVRRGTSN